MRKKYLTAKQMKVYDAWTGFLAKRKRPPTYQELANIMGYNSKGSIHFHMHKLIDKGWIKPE